MSTGAQTKPPRLATALIRMTMSRGSVRDTILGDLAQEFYEIAARESPRPAVRWYWRQAASVVARSLADRLRGRPWSGPHRAGEGGRGHGQPGPLRLARSSPGFALGGVGRDLRFAVRQLSGRPGFTFIAVLSLALGIGANTAIFSVVNTVLIRDLPVRAPEELVEIFTGEGDGYPYGPSAYPDVMEIRQRTDLFSGVIAHEGFFSSVETDVGTEKVIGELVTHDIFSMLGLEPLVGRAFLPEEDRTLGTHPVVILGHGYWERRYGGDPGVVGRSIRLRGRMYTIVGVAPESVQSFLGPGLVVDLFVPYMMAEELDWIGDGRDLLHGHGHLGVFATGRLRPGVPIEQARAGLATLATRLEAAYPESHLERTFHLLPSREVAVHPIIDRALVPVAALLMSVVGLVLLIACTNLAGFLLARAVDRRKEIAIRLALGASRGTLIRQLLTETVLLALFGGAAGVVVASWVLGLLVGLQPPIAVPIHLDFSPDRTVLLFTLGVSTAVGLLFGLLPALQATNPDVAPTLKDEADSSGGGTHRLSLRNGLLVTQVAVSVLLLVGAGLFVRSLGKIGEVDPGFTTREAGIVSVDYAIGGVPPEERENLSRALVERARGLPGVEGVGAAELLPLGIFINSRIYTIPGVEAPQGGENHGMPTNTVGPAFFEVMGIPLVEGRGITADDRSVSLPVVVVSETAARRYWPGESPIGREIFPAGTETHYRVVGVAGDTKINTLGEALRPHVYFARAQVTPRGISVVATGSASEAEIVAGLRSVVRELDPGLVIMEAKTMTEHLSVTLYPPRMAALLLGVFGLLALLLATTGLYGAVSYTVSRRTREVGIRVSLGASPAGVVRTMLGGGLGLVAVGGAVGLTASLGVAQLLGRFLYGISASDPATYFAVAAVLGVVAFLATFIPARRASRVDPVIALRYE